MGRYVRLSVLVPVYQVSEYLRPCVDSLIRCTSDEDEIWLVDDGSTDGSGEICDAYAAVEPRVHVIHQQNGGLNAARIAGIQAAQGEYIAFVDSDDWVSEDLFERLLAPFAQEDVDVAAGGYLVEAAEGARPGISFEPTPAVLPSKEALRWMFACRGFHWSLWGKVYRARIFRNASFLPSWPESYGEDTYVNYNVFQQIRKAAYVPVQGYHYRMRGTSMMHQAYHAGWMAYFRIYDEILQDAMGKDSILATEILRHAVNVGTSIRKELLDSRTHLDDAERMRKYFLRWRSFLLRAEVPELAWRWAYAAEPTASEYEARRKKWENEIRSFAASAPTLWIYGAGRIGQDFARWLDPLNIRWDGFVETKPRTATCLEKPVCALHDLSPSTASILVAMNERHTAEVRPLLGAGGFMHTLEGWRMHFSGRA